MSAGNLYALVRERFPADPEAVFLEAEDGPLTYAGLDALTARLQTVLRARGVAPGDRVVAQVDKTPGAIILYLACLRAGAVYVPLNTAYTEAEVAYFVADAQPALVVTDPAPLLAAAETAESDRSVEDRRADDAAAICYTSGTTGRPKGAVLSHGNLASNALTLYDLWGWRPDDMLLHALPIHHVHGLFVALHCALLGGSRVLFLPRFDTARVRAALPRATVMMGVPTFYSRLLADPAFGAGDCRSMRLFISGSAPLSAATFADFERRTGHRILERYGMTEAGMITSNPYAGERVPGSVGFPLPGVEARLADGDPGMLEIRGPNVFRGYWGRPEQTAEAFTADGFLRTGDLATMDAEGRVTLVGRASDLIITGGLNVYPREVEDALDALPGIRESAVIGLPHADFGEAVTALVVPEDGAPVNEAAILADLSTRLAGFKRPKRVIPVDSLPRNAMGKVEKPALRRAYRETYG